MKKALVAAAAVVGAIMTLSVLPFMFSGGPSSASASAPETAGGDGLSTDPTLLGLPGSRGTPVPVSAIAAFAGVPPGGFPDRFPYGQCTWYAAYNWAGRHGQGVAWSGDAWEWLGNAAAAGYATSAQPTVGAIVVFRRVSGYDRQFGHVAVVVAVTPSSYTVSESNYVNDSTIDRRTLAWPDSDAAGFIPAPG